jgi:formate dehydrogenase alpha subunit
MSSAQIAGPGRLRLTIDDREVEVRPGATLLEAAAAAGAVVPTLCHYPLLRPSGACRMCLVEVEGARSLLTACSTPAAPGMVVRTSTDRVRTARRDVIELLLAEHPLDCLTCERTGSCLLQDYAYEYGADGKTIAGMPYTERPARDAAMLDQTNHFFVRDLEKCILCGRCVRMCAEVMGYAAVDFVRRGAETKVTTSFDVPIEESSCVFCGNCITVCPTGALHPKQGRGQGRSFQYHKVRTICPYCGVGCSIHLHVRAGRIIGSSPAYGPANRSLLCVKGHFGHDWVQSPDRLTEPLIRQPDGSFRVATWDEALDLVAARLGAIRAAHGPDSIGGLCSAKCTNEENYLFQRMMRAAIGTNNVDHCARLCHASTVAGLAVSFGSGAMTNSYWEFEDSDAFFIIGSNTTETHPVIGAVVERGRQRGAKLIVADPRYTEMAARADLWLQQRPGTDVPLLNAMMHVILAEGLADRAFIEERTEGFDELAAKVAEYPPKVAAAICGVPAEDIVAAARMYARAGAAATLYSMGITQHTTGVNNVRSIANLAMLTGNVGKRAAGVNPLRGQNNVQGSCDMGGLPGSLPGYQLVVNEEHRAKFEAAWGVKLNPKPGLTILELLDGASRGTVRALYIMGENPMVSDPDLTHVEEALDALDFLVVQDIFMTETARLADVVLPAASYAEKTGTFTNSERRVQLIRPAVAAPGRALPDSTIICDLATRLGHPLRYANQAAVMGEIASLTPIYGGISYERLVHGGLQWPCTGPEHPGTPFLHAGRFTRGRGQFAAIDYRPPAEEADGDYPMVLTTGRMLYHFHTGTMTRRSAGLNAHVPEGYIEVSEADLRDLGVRDGDWIKVTSRRGSVRTRARVAENMRRGVVFMPFHFAEAAANVLTNTALDPLAKIPELKVCAVRLEAAGDGGDA